MLKFFFRLCGFFACFFVSSLRSLTAQRPVEALCDDLEPRVLFSGVPAEPEDPQAATETPIEEGKIGDQTGSDQNPN